MKRILFGIIVALGFLGASASQAQAAHFVQLSFTGPSCTAAKPCTGTVYRANGTCPASGIGTLSYATLTSTLVGTIAPDGLSSSFNYNDNAVAATATYCYYATVTYTGTFAADGQSAPSNTFQGQIPGAPAASTLNGVVK